MIASAGICFWAAPPGELSSGGVLPSLVPVGIPGWATSIEGIAEMTTETAAGREGVPAEGFFSFAIALKRSNSTIGFWKDLRVCLLTLPMYCSTFSPRLLSRICPNPSGKPRGSETLDFAGMSASREAVCCCLVASVLELTSLHLTVTTLTSEVEELVELLKDRADTGGLL